MIVITGLVPVIHGAAGVIYTESSNLADGWIAGINPAMTIGEWVA
jgi:hypothetical protein